MVFELEGAHKTKGKDASTLGVQPCSTESSRSSSPVHSNSSRHSSCQPAQENGANRRPRIKLPKLTLRKFNGDITQWSSSFNTAIHSNTELSNVDKFNYLNSLLEKGAADAVAGLALTSANYEEAVSVLKQHSGKLFPSIWKSFSTWKQLPQY